MVPVYILARILKINCKFLQIFFLMFLRVKRLGSGSRSKYNVPIWNNNTDLVPVF